MFSFRRAGSLIAATTTTAVVLTGLPFAGAAEADQVKISVANITDFHGRLEANYTQKTVGKDENGKDVKVDDPTNGDEMGAANVAGIVNYIRSNNPNTIVTTSGDNQGGSAFVSAISDDKYTMEFLKQMGTHGSAVGNHEFDKGYDDLLNRIIPGTKVGDEEIQLGANIFKEDGSRDVRPYRIVEVEGVKVALVGTTSNLTVTKSNPAHVAGLDIKDSSRQVNEVAKELKGGGKADVVIALIHDPAKEASEILDPEVVDFVFGGDSHVQTLDTAARVPYAQSYEYGKVVTDLDFTFDKVTGKIVGLDARQYGAGDLERLGVTPDAEVAKTVAEAKKEADVLGQQVVATIGSDFKRGSNPGDKPGTNRGTESTASNMIAQSAVAALSAFLDQKIDFGIMNAGGVRDDLQTGDVTYAQAFKVQPFGNNIAVATVSGAAIKEMLENQWQTEEAAAKSGRPRLDLGLSDNVSYTYNPDAPRGEKILSITINGEEVDPGKDYTVAGSTFLFDGGDAFIPKSEAAETFRDRNDVGYNDLQAFIDYLKSGKAEVRKGQKDVGVVLPEGGLKAGAKNEIQLSSLSYSSEGEPQAKTVTVKIGGTTVTADVDNAVTAADKGYGEQGRATVAIELPADVYKDETLTITTNVDTEISMPVAIEGGKERPANRGEGTSTEISTGAAVVLGILSLVGLGSILAIVFGPQLHAILGPLAYLGSSR